MTLDTLIIGAGALTALLPFLGFPNSWDTVLFFLIGVFIVGLGIAARRRRGAEETLKRRQTGTFSESISAQTSAFPRHEDREEMGSE